MTISTRARPHGISSLVFAGLLIWSANAQVTGYRGDGFCVTPDARLPDKLAVVWQTSLPNWGLGCPIVVKDRVYVVSEPDRDHDFPQLLCLSATDGRVLWQQEIPHAVDEPVRRAWHDHLVALRNLYRARHAYDTTRDEAVLAQFGCALNDKGQVSWQKSDPSQKHGDRLDVKLARIFNKAGLYFDVWHLGGLHRIGYGFPTPVSDGQRIYVATGLHSFACYDLDGNLVWQARSVGQGSSQAGYGGDDFCKNARSPLIYSNLFISDVGNLVRAFDKDTGKLLWSHKHTGHEIVSPVILTIAGRDYLLTATVTACELPDGRKLSVAGWKNHGGTMLVKSDERDVVFFTGGGEHGGWQNKGKPPCETPPPAAVRFAREADTLKATVLWSGMDGETSGECHTGLVYLNGKLYHPHGVILDAATGKTLAGKPRDRHNRATPATRHLLWIVGDRIVGVREDKGTGQVEVYDLAGKKTDQLTLTPPVAEGERKDRIVETVGAPSWGFSYGSPFTVAGDRLYVRSNGELWCVGRQ